MESWVALIIILLLMALTYISRLMEERLANPFYHTKSSSTEGFTDVNGIKVAGAYPESKGIIRWLDNTELYDAFTASVYDQLTQGSVRTQAEIGLLLHQWTKRGEELAKFEVLDAGCGTGIATAALAKIGCKRVVGLDSSDAMMNQAKTITLPNSTLTNEQKEKAEWRTANLTDPSVCAAGEFTHTCLLYFTIYYFTDKEALFRNIHMWTKPGGHLAVHVVNKHKFDPMLESAAPWLGFSLQKYTNDRITKSEVTFDKFKYTGEFDLHDPEAEFRETFRFQDGTVRRQRHTFKMENMDEIVGMAKVAGWKYDGFIDETPIHFEYAYLLLFTKE